MRFDVLALLNLTVAIVSFIVSVVAGYVFRSVWAFVAGELAGTLRRLSFLIARTHIAHACSIRPKPQGLCFILGAAM